MISILIGSNCCCAYAITTQSIDINSLMQQYRQVQTAPQVLSAQRNNILIFISFSMSETSLKQWLAEANKIGAPVVLRGFVNNSFKQTAADLQTVLGTKHGGIQIDPPSFEKYSITQVPAVVMTTTSDDYDVVYGNASLDDVLDVFIKEGQPDIQANARQLQHLLNGDAA
ncbi:MAG: type-F conjugative transfer system pilin assembly protein TrbC [Gammaproteobacteria bacterium]